MKETDISPVDTLFVNGSYPIEFLFYYRHRIKSKSFRSSLRNLSSTFWPAFGKYECGTIRSRKYAEQNHFDETALDENFIIDASHENMLKQYGRAIPDDINSMFFIKMMHYRNGTVLIPRMSHLAGDGYSYFYLLSVLAALCETIYIPFKKIILLRLSRPHHNRIIQKSFRFRDLEFNQPEIEENLSIQFEEMTEKVVRKMIQKVSEISGKQVSPNDVLSAMSLKKLTSLQENFSHKTVSLTIPVDVRRYIEAYGRKFFGNGLMFHKAKFVKSEIKESTTEKLAAAIRESMPAITGQYYLDYLQKLEGLIAENNTDQLRPFHPGSGILVTNLSKLPVSKLNFGTGAPEFVFPLTIEKNSAAIFKVKNTFVLRFAY